MSRKIRFFMLLAYCTMSLPALADDEWIITITDTSVSRANTAGLTTTSETTALKELESLFANQDPATNKVPLSTNFDVKDNKKDVSELSYISHPDIAVKFFQTCTKELNGYVAVSFDTTGALKTKLNCYTADGMAGYDETPESNSEYNKIFKARLNYANTHCKKFDGIIGTMPQGYNAKYGPILGLGASNVYFDVNVNSPKSEYRNYCYISFPAPIPAGKKIIQINADDKFAKAKQLCTAAKGTFVIDSYTAPGRSLYASKNSLYKFALCIFTTAGNVDSQLASETWEHANDLKLYKDKLPSGQAFSPDKTGKRCKNSFSGKDIGDVNYLGQALPMEDLGYYTACLFSVVDHSHNGEIFE